MTEIVSPPPGSPAYYDALAEGYDDMFVNPSDLEEDEQVQALLKGHFGDGLKPSCLDVGCGTGLLLDWGIVNPNQYIGFDPSRGMLGRLMQKNPNVRTHLGTADDVLPQIEDAELKFRLVVALYASATYTTPENWQTMVDLSTDMVVFMTYQPGHLMEFYDRPGVKEAALKMMTQRAALMEDFADEQRAAGHVVWRSEIGKFDVTVILK